MNTIRILLGVLCVGFVLVFYFLIRISEEDLYLKRLQYIPVAQFMDIIALHGIFILRNEKIYNFFKRQIKSQLPCCFSSMQLLDDGSFAIYALGHAALHPINAPITSCNQNLGYNTEEFEPADVLVHPVKEWCNEVMTTRDKTSSRRHSI